MDDEKPNGHTDEQDSNGFTEEYGAEGSSVAADDWHLPDDESWHDSPGYNLAVASALRQAYTHLTAGSGTSVYLEAFNSIAGILDADMSSRQRLAVLYIAALSLSLDDPPLRALPVIDDALELALKLDIERAQEDLLLLRASINRWLFQVPDAAEDLQHCLNLIAVRGETHMLTRAELDARLKALLHLAGSEFVIGNYDHAGRLLDRAAPLIPRAPSNTQAPLLLAWTRALLLRWRGAYELALTQAMEAADGYAANGPPEMAGRIRSIVGEIALDLAERCRNNHQPLAFAAFLSLAEPYIVRAIELAADRRESATEDDNATETMASITQCRFLLLKGEGTGEGRIAWLQELAQRGAQHQDLAIVAQAYTQLGREYEARDDLPTAIHWYQRTLAVLKESRMVALGVWAQRALWRLGGETQAGPEVGPA